MKIEGNEDLTNELRHELNTGNLASLRTPESLADLVGEIKLRGGRIDRNFSPIKGKRNRRRAGGLGSVAVRQPSDTTTDNGRTDRLDAGIDNQHTPEFMRVWHGSAAVFDHFDSSHFLEGEGSMVYGAGHYVTNVEGTGRMYTGIALASAMGRTGVETNVHTQDVTLDGKTADDFEYNSVGYQALMCMARATLVRSKAIERQEDFIKYCKINNFKESNIKKEEEILDILKSDRIEIHREIPVPACQLYEVEIPDDNGKNYLGWNDMLTDEQKEQLRPILVESAQDAGLSQETAEKIADIDMNGDMTVGEFFNKAKMSKETSKKLTEFGYVGVKVSTDNNNGGDGRGMNYVIFDDNDLDIKSRVEFMQRPNGTVYGWTEGNRVHLTPEGINPESPVHEYTHLWAKAVKARNPELWKNVVELMKQLPAWGEAVGYGGCDAGGEG